MGNLLSSVCPAPTDMKSAAMLSAVSGNSGAVKNAAKAVATGKAMNIMSGKAALPSVSSLFSKPAAAAAPAPPAKAASAPAAPPAKAAAAAPVAANKAKSAIAGLLKRGGSRRQRRQKVRKDRSRSKRR